MHDWRPGFEQRKPVVKGVDALVWRAVVLLREGETEQALGCAELALEQEPGHLGAHLVSGEVFARQGDRVSAQSAFRKWVRKAPELALGDHLLRSVGGKGFETPLRGEVSELFDHYAPTFESHLLEGLGYRGHEALPEALASLLDEKTCETIVDLGCGTGLCGRGLRPLARRLVGVDVSPAILDEARGSELYDLLFVADLVWALATCADASVDMIVAADVLGYLGALEAVFQEAHRVLRPKQGRVAFTVEAWLGAEPYVLGDSRRCAFSERYLRTLAEGWTIERLERVALRSESSEPVEGWLAVWRA